MAQRRIGAELLQCEFLGGSLAGSESYLFEVVTAVRGGGSNLRVLSGRRGVEWGIILFRSRKQRLAEAVSHQVQGIARDTLGSNKQGERGYIPSKSNEEDGVGYKNEKEYVFFKYLGSIGA